MLKASRNNVIELTIDNNTYSGYARASVYYLWVPGCGYILASSCVSVGGPQLPGQQDFLPRHSVSHSCGRASCDPSATQNSVRTIRLYVYIYIYTYTLGAYFKTSRQPRAMD